MLTYLRHRFEIPIVLGISIHTGDQTRCKDERVGGIVGSCLDDEDFDGGIFGETTGYGEAGRSPSYDDVVKYVVGDGTHDFCNEQARDVEGAMLVIFGAELSRPDAMKELLHMCCAT